MLATLAAAQGRRRRLGAAAAALSAAEVGAAGVVFSRDFGGEHGGGTWMVAAEAAVGLLP